MKNSFLDPGLVAFEDGDRLLKLADPRLGRNGSLFGPAPGLVTRLGLGLQSRVFNPKARDEGQGLLYAAFKGPYLLDAQHDRFRP